MRSFATLARKISISDDKVQGKVFKIRGKNAA